MRELHDYKIIREGLSRLLPGSFREHYLGYLLDPNDIERLNENPWKIVATYEDHRGEIVTKLFIIQIRKETLRENIQNGPKTSTSSGS